jgi:hypothetical protein
MESNQVNFAFARAIMLHSSFSGVVTFVISLFAGYVVAKLISVKVDTESKQAKLFIVSPIIVFALSSIAYCLDACSLTMSDVATAGAVLGMIASISTISAKPISLKLCVKNDGTITRDLEFADYSQVSSKDIISAIAAAFSAPTGVVRFESGRGSFIEEPAKVPVTELISIIDSSSKTMVRAICYISIDSDNPEHNSTVSKRRSSLLGNLGSLLPSKLPMPLSLNMKPEVKRGVEIALIGKIPNAANDASSFHVSCVDSYAAGTTKGSDARICILPWRESTSLFSGGQDGAGADDDAISVGGRSAVTQGAEDQASDAPICCGDTVVLRHDGK